jgi:AcrR family transcriptional regulator
VARDGSPPRHGSDRLLDAARKLLRDGGPRAVTVLGMAQLAQVSAPALYKHFSGRDEVLARLKAEGWQAFSEALTQCSSARTPLARLRRCGLLYVDFGLANPNLYRLLLLSDESPTPPSPDEPRWSPGLAFLIELVRECQRFGALPRRVKAEDLALAFWATCHGLVALHLSGGGAERFSQRDYQRLARRALVSLTQPVFG